MEISEQVKQQQQKQLRELFLEITLINKETNLEDS